MKFNLIIDKTKNEELTLTVHERSDIVDKIEAIVAELDGTDRLIAYNNDELKLLRFSDIECVTVINGKTYAVDTKGTKLRLKKRLFEIEDLLPDYFIRINKSSIANEKRLEKFTTAFSGAVDAVFKCGYVEYVSRRCFSEIKRRFNKK
jgi:DNA-binding LytR/AlgR family response regulator